MSIEAAVSVEVKVSLEVVAPAGAVDLSEKKSKISILSSAAICFPASGLVSQKTRLMYSRLVSKTFLGDEPLASKNRHNDLG